MLNQIRRDLNDKRKNIISPSHKVKTTKPGSGCIGLSSQLLGGVIRNKERKSETCLDSRVTSCPSCTT